MRWSYSVEHRCRFFWDTVYNAIGKCTKRYYERECDFNAVYRRALPLGLIVQVKRAVAPNHCQIVTANHSFCPTIVSFPIKLLLFKCNEKCSHYLFSLHSVLTVIGDFWFITADTVPAPSPRGNNWQDSTGRSLMLRYDKYNTNMNQFGTVRSYKTCSDIAINQKDNI